MEITLIQRDGTSCGQIEIYIAKSNESNLVDKKSFCNL